MTITYHPELWGSDEWRAVRCGLTTGEMKFIITPRSKWRANDKER